MKIITDKTGGKHLIPKDSSEPERHFAPNNVYTSRYLHILKDHYNIFFDGHGCFAFKVIHRENHNPLIMLFTEDDGTLTATDIKFDAFWAKSFIDSMQLTLDYVNKYYDIR